MGQNSQIEWCHHTFNPWVGCTKVSAACDFCYAESWAKRSGMVEWGNHPRRRTSEQNWKKPYRWNNAVTDRRQRVFCASLADVFDNQVQRSWRTDLMCMIANTPNLDWLLLTKRPQNVERMVDRFPPNVWLGITAENQDEYDRRWPYLHNIDVSVKFVSYEPALGPLEIFHRPGGLPGWIIAGGESGPHRRKPDPDWFRDIRDQCAALNIPFLFKQWGGLRPKDGGRALDGVIHDGYPTPRGK